MTEITPGELATIYVGSDRYALIVHRISPSKKTIYCKYARKVQGDKWGIDTARMNETISVRKNKFGEYRQLNRSSYRPRVVFGKAEEYRDPSF